jgi:hypothetical protein
MMETKIKAKKLGIIDLLGGGWSIYRANIKTIFTIVLCVYFPIDLIIAFVPRNTQLYNLILGALQFFIGILATIAIAIITEKAIEGKSVDWIEALQFARSKWTKAIGTGLLLWIRILGFMLLLIIPGLIYSLYYVFWDSVVALRDRSGKEALEYSKKLVVGQWWRIFEITLIIVLLAIILSQGVSYLMSLISDNPFFGIIPNLLTDIVGSFITVTFVLLFLNNDFVRRTELLAAVSSVEAL